MTLKSRESFISIKASSGNIKSHQPISLTEENRQIYNRSTTVTGLSLKNRLYRKISDYNRRFLEGRLVIYTAVGPSVSDHPKCQA